MHIDGLQKFPETVSPFLQDKLTEAKENYGEDSFAYQSIARQYLKDAAENQLTNWQSDRHYDADMSSDENGEHLKGVERLYRRTVLLELTTACFTNCRWCLRQNYSRFALRKDKIVENVSYFGSDNLRDEVNEVLITGGDPMIVPQRLDLALTEIARQAPNIRVVRIGSRVFSHNPGQVDDDLVRMFVKHRKSFRIEIGTHINSPVEFWPETIAAILKLQDAGVVFYNQHPLLKGVNDSFEALSELYDQCRFHSIEPHYLFHCIPLQGMQHHRTTVQRGLDLIRRLTSGGYFSGRAKPNFAAMTDIGKITFYEGTIVDRDEERGRLLLQSGYSLEERLMYNPSYTPTESTVVDENGLLQVWYPDGVDDNFWRNWLS
jgi:lysine 2,3-aminomutase